VHRDDGGVLQARHPSGVEGADRPTQQALTTKRLVRGAKWPRTGSGLHETLAAAIGLPGFSPGDRWSTELPLGARPRGAWRPLLVIGVLLLTMVADWWLLPIPSLWATLVVLVQFALVLWAMQWATGRSPL